MVVRKTKEDRSVRETQPVVLPVQKKNPYPKRTLGILHMYTLELVIVARSLRSLVKI